jgi:photosystem II stability/assembly factor-like uncharacterized protein
MKTVTLFKSKLLLLIVAMIALVSCEKTNDTGDRSGPIDIDRPIAGEATIIGIVTDTNGDPMAGVNVSCGNATGVTNAKGRFQLDDAPEGNGMPVNFMLDGYMTTQKKVDSKKDSERLVFATMTPEGKVTMIDAATGGTADHAGMTVEFPANAFVNSDGSAFTGEAEVSVTFVPITTGEFTNVFPGDFSGIREDGSEAFVESFGFSDINITAGNEELELAPGVLATLTYPVSDAQKADAPATIPLWYYDFDRAEWIEEGAATLNGDIYTGQVSHFTPWNVDKPIEVADLRGRVVDGEGNPLENAYVRVVAQGTIGWVFTAYSDENGEFTTKAEANQSVKARAFFNAVESQEEMASIGAEGSSNTIADLIIDISALLPGWEAVDVGEDGSFTDVFFLDCNTGWAIETFGYDSTETPTLNIYKTTDGGKNWTSTDINGSWSNYSVRKSMIKFKNAEFGVALSGVGSFYTEDGGDTWTDFISTTDHKISDADNIIFGDGNTVSIIGSKGVSTTTDLGQTVTTTDIASIFDTQDYKMFLKSHLVSDNEYYIFASNSPKYEGVNDYTIARTTDGGTSWTSEEIMGAPFKMYPNRYSGTFREQSGVTPLFSLNADKHYSIGGNSFYTSLDEMSSWNNLSTTAPSFASTLFMLDENKIYVGTDMGGLFVTRDGGQTWEQYLNASGAAILDIHMCDGENGVAVGASGTILRLSKAEWLDL